LVLLLLPPNLQRATPTVFLQPCHPKIGNNFAVRTKKIKIGKINNLF
jgi:hypothetical protein